MVLGLKGGGLHPITTLVCTAGALGMAAPGLCAATLSDKPALRENLILAHAQISEIEKRLPPPTPKDAPELADETTMPEAPALREGPKAVHTLMAVEVVGASAYSPDSIAPLYEDLLARAVTIKDIIRLTERITEKYHQDGFFLSRAIAPPQSLETGILRIEIQEGFLKAIAVEGDVSPGVRRRLEPLKAMKPLRLTELERVLLLVGDLNGVSVRKSSIEADPNDLAGHLLRVVIDKDPFEASLFADNRGTEEAGPVQTHIRGAANSILLTGDQLSAGFFTIPNDPEELVLGDVHYQFPLTRTGAYMTLSGMVSRFDAGATLAAFDTESRTKRLAARLSFPFIRTRKRSLWANLAIEGRNIEEEQFGAEQFKDKIRVVSASTNYRQQFWNGETTIYLEGRQGLKMLGASDSGMSLSRPDADGSFTKIETKLTRYQNIGKTFGLYGAFAGQVSFEPLLASEEFAIGGAQFGRAYNYAELTGDDGLSTLIELRHGRNPKTALIDFYQFYGFYDYGKVWNENAAPGFSSLSMSSAGAGLRLTFPDSLYLSVEAARPLDRTPFTQNDRDWRGFFSVSKGF